MTRRLTIICHWALFILMLTLVKGGTADAAWRWAFVTTGLTWLTILATVGLRAKPGPKLTGPLRRIFRPSHWAMYALVAVSTALNLGAIIDFTPLNWAWNSLLALFAASMFHAILHLWRHTTQNDGALRVMTPRFMHKHL